MCVRQHTDIIRIHKRQKLLTDEAAEPCGGLLLVNCSGTCSTCGWSGRVGRVRWDCWWCGLSVFMVESGNWKHTWSLWR